MDQELMLLKKEWQDLYYRIAKTHPPDYERALVISPYWGYYGLCGYVITIEGSPVHGTLICDLYRESMLLIEFGYPKTRFVRKDIRSTRKLWEKTLELFRKLELTHRIGVSEKALMPIRVEGGDYQQWLAGVRAREIDQDYEEWLDTN